jgi:acyl carrier protein
MFEKKSQTIEESVRQLMIERAWLEQQDSVSDTDSLVDHGIIDSLTMMELIGFLEQTYEIQVTDDELIPENFETLSAIAGFVEQKRTS